MALIEKKGGGGGGGSTENTFQTIQTPAGTSPVADSSTDTLNLTTSDSTVIITGTAGTDTVDFKVGASVYVSGGTDVAVTDGGTGASTAAAGFDNLAPTTTRGDLIARGAAGNTRLAVGSVNKVLVTDGTDPTWALLADVNIDSAAAIARSKIATGTAYGVVTNSNTGALTSVAPGSSGNILKSDGTQWTSAALTASIVDSLGIYILNPIDRTYVIDSYAPAAYTINSIGIKCSTGTCTAKIQIDGVDVTSLTSLSVSSVNTTATASGANSVSAGSRVTLVLTSTSVIQDLEMTLKVTR